MATKVRGISIELSADASGVLDSLSDINKQTKSTASQLKDVEKLLKLDPSNTTLLTQKTELLQQQIGNTKTKLDELKKAQQDMDANGVDKNSEQYQALQREIIATEQELKTLENTAGSSSAALAQISEVTGNIGDKMEAVGKKMSVVSAGIVAIGAAALSSFETVDEGMDTVIKKTGATGEQADELEEIYKEVASEIVGDFSEIGSAIGEVSTRFGSTGDELKDLTEDFLKFADVNDINVETAVSGVDKALKTFNLDSSEATNVMGLLTQKSQETGISVDTMISLLQGSGDTFKEMGLGIEESITLMSNFEKAGVDSSTILSKMTKAATYFNSKGLDMRSGLEDLTERLSNSSTEADAAAEVYEIFGKKAGLAFINLAKEGKLNFNDLADAMGDYTDVVDTTYEATQDGSDKMKLAWQNMQIGLSELGGAIGDTLAPIMDKITTTIQGVVRWFTNLDDGAKNTIVTVGLLVASIGPLLIVGGKVMSGISAITGTLSKLGSSTGGIIGLVIAGIAALALALASMTDSFLNSRTEGDGLYDTIKKIKEENEKLAEQIEATSTTYEESSKNAEVEAETAGVLMSKLEELMAVENKSAGQKEQIKAIVDQLNEIVPDLALAYDEERDSLNMTSDEVQRYIDLSMIQAKTDAAKSFYTGAIENQMTAQKNYNDVLETYNELLSRNGMTQEQVNRYMEAGAGAGRTWKDIARELNMEYDDAWVYLQEVAEGYRELTGAQENLTEATADVEYAYGELEKNTEALAAASQESAANVEASAEQMSGAADTYEDAADKITESNEEIAGSAQETADKTTEANSQIQASAETTNEVVTEEMSGVNDAYDSVDGSGAVAEAQTTGEMMADASDISSETGSNTADAMDAIITNVDSKITALGTAFSGIVMKASEKLGVGSMFQTNLKNYGGKIPTLMAQGATSQQATLMSAFSNIVNSVSREVNQLQSIMQNAGYYAGQGLANGLYAMWGSVYNAAASLASAAKQGAYITLRVHSPSKVFKDLGNYIGQGLSIGIEDSETEVYKSASNLAGEVVSAFDDMDNNYTVGIQAVNAGIADNAQAQNAYNANSLNNSNNVIGLLQQMIPYLAADKDIYFDDGTWAGKLAPELNKSLGSLAVRSSRL